MEPFSSAKVISESSNTLIITSYVDSASQIRCPESYEVDYNGKTIQIKFTVCACLYDWSNGLVDLNLDMVEFSHSGLTHNVAIAIVRSVISQFDEYNQQFIEMFLGHNQIED